MRRRTLLAASGSYTAVVLSGCLGREERDRYELDRDPEGESVLEHEVELQQPVLQDPDQPLQIQTAVTNPSDKKRVYGDYKQALGYGYQRDSFEFFPDTNLPAHEFVDSWWTVTEQVPRVDERRERWIEPGETHERTLLLLVTDHESNPDDTPDEIGFSFTYQVGEQEYSPDGQVAEWGFSLVNRS